MIEDLDYKKIAKQLFDDIQKVPLKNTPKLRRVRQKYSKKLAQAAPEQILDMVIKALSWALRVLIPHDRESVLSFLRENENVLASRVKREVKNKLTTEVKNPRRKVE